MLIIIVHRISKISLQTKMMIFALYQNSKWELKKIYLFKNCMIYVDFIYIFIREINWTGISTILLTQISRLLLHLRANFWSFPCRVEVWKLPVNDWKHSGIQQKYGNIQQTRNFKQISANFQKAWKFPAKKLTFIKSLYTSKKSRRWKRYEEKAKFQIYSHKVLMAEFLKFGFSRIFFSSPEHKSGSL